MTFGRDDFDDFFAGANEGHRPFAWQQRLLDFILESQSWPDNIDAPTGSGKSNVVDVHVFATALHAIGRAPRLPRRLSVVVNRRALVDQHLERARALVAYLDASTPLATAISTALSTLTDGGPPLSVVSLRGGVKPDREWVDDPRACAIIAATPDMWGSRLLFRGYGSSVHARPREAGLLGVDSVAVLDEAHLNRQLVHTARRVARWGCEEATRLGVPGLQVVGTTATPSDRGNAIGLVEADVSGPDQDGALVHRLTSAKPVMYHDTARWAGKGRATPAYVEELADLIMPLVVEAEERAVEGVTATVLAVVNRVDTAARLTTVLRKRFGAADSVVPWVGRMRPLDLDMHRRHRPGLFTATGDPSVKVIVATQTVEVGVDIDAAAMVTEIAPASALAQRLGRVNRLGRRSAARAIVVGPPADNVADAAPYTELELRDALEWVQRVVESPSGASPWALSRGDLVPPAARLPRQHLSFLQAPDAWFLAETSLEHFAAADLAFWLRDSLEPDDDPVTIVLRAFPVGGDAPATSELHLAALVKHTLPTEEEQFPCTRMIAREVLSIVANADPELRRAVRVRGEDLTECVVDIDDESGTAATLSDIRAGDIYVIDRGHPVTLAGVVVGQGGAVEEHATLWGVHETEVLWAHVPPDAQRIEDLVSQRIEEMEQGQSHGDARHVTQRETFFPPEALWDEGTLPVWVVVVPASDVADDAERRQEWTVRESVRLDAHSEAVASRAAHLADRLGLLSPWVDTLRLSGLYHDTGKVDERFQQRLGAPPEEAWAKSGASAQILRRPGRDTLPRGWRHEQRSVVHAHVDIADTSMHEMILRLVGTSHGRGRPLFPHGDIELLQQGEPDTIRTAAADLFGAAGGWTEIIERTHENVGIWACAYLEAILRSADCAVSKEGG